MQNFKGRNFRKIITHKNCADGVASAIILHDLFPQASVEFVQYNTDQHTDMVVEEGVLFCDFTPHKSKVDAFREAGAVILDHHIGAKDMVLSFGDNGVFADEKLEPGVSGATLAFRLWSALKKASFCDILFGRSKRRAFEHFANLAGIRDTWQSESPLWEEALAQYLVLNFFPESSWLDHKFGSKEFSKKYDLGAALFSSYMQKVTAMAKKGFVLHADSGHEVLMIDDVTMTSDVCEYCRKHRPDIDIVAGYFFMVNKEGLRAVASLRSAKEHIDVLSIAKKYGGGGHTKAAGFNVKVGFDQTPYAVFRPYL